MSIAEVAAGCGHVSDFASPHAADRRKRAGTWIARDFKFHTGEVMPELGWHYTTIGEPTGRAGAGAARHDRSAPAC